MYLQRITLYAHRCTKRVGRDTGGRREIEVQTEGIGATTTGSESTQDATEGIICIVFHIQSLGYPRFEFTCFYRGNTEYKVLTKHNIS